MEEQIGAGHEKDIGKNAADPKLLRRRCDFGHHCLADKKRDGIFSRPIVRFLPSIHQAIIASQYLMPQHLQFLLCQHTIE